MAEDMTIPNTILTQLRTGNRRKIMVMSWGAHNFVGSGKERFLTFKVRGNHFKGYVKITLNGMDTYDVDFIKEKTTEVEKRIEGLYCDNFTEVIDEYVEKVGAYSF